MSQELKALEDIKTWFSCHDYDQLHELETIEKGLKALEIIKKYIVINKPFGTACYIYLNDESELIPQEEFDLLKEVFL